MAYYLDAARRFLFLHASLRGESDARRGFRRESHASRTVRYPLRYGARRCRESVKKARENDLIFIGGSTFIVADALPLFMKEDEYK